MQIFLEQFKKSDTIVILEAPMLVRATFSNIYSFDAPQTISFVAGKGRRLVSHTLRKKSRYAPSLLKSAIVYGANASGKSNLVKCFDFARRMIVNSSRVDEPIQRTPFRLRLSAAHEPSSFEFEIGLDEKLYAYKLAFDDHVILEESLTRILATSEHVLYSRTWTGTDSNIELYENFADKEEKQRFQFIAKNTRPNQPFLTETVESNSERYRNIYDWFRYGIEIIYPEAIFVALDLVVKPGKKIATVYEEFFRNLGLGIAGIREIGLDSEGSAKEIPADVLNNLKKELKNGGQITLTGPNKNRYHLAKDKNGKFELYKIMIAHEIAETHEQVPFDLQDESDGTLRLIDLIPALADMCENEKLYVIDELDRSMHAQLTRAFLEYFFSCSASRSQILATTHELDLLDLDLLRKDEIWFVEKDHSSASHLYSLEEFKPRYDKDIRKGYLQGRFGAIPVIRNLGTRMWGK